MLPTLAISAGYTHPFTADSISHDGVAASAEIRPMPVISFGVAGTLYAPFEQSYIPSPAVFPLTTTYGTISAIVKVFVLRGHDEETKNHEQSYEVYLSAGPGILEHKPVAALDPAFRKFDYTTSLTFSGGIGARYFPHRSIALFADIRAMSFIAQHENVVVAPGSLRADPTTWLGERPLSVVVEPQVGVTFVPFSL